MHALNRLLALILLLLLAVASLASLLVAVGGIQVSGLAITAAVQSFHLDRSVNIHSADLAGSAGRYVWQWVGASAGTLVLAAVLVYLELRGARPERVVVLHESKDGSTRLVLGAVGDLARWTAEDVDGVEALPAVRVRRRGKRLVVRGTALLNPFVNARETAPVLQERLQEDLSRASGFPVEVRLRSRFQDPEARRKAR